MDKDYLLMRSYLKKNSDLKLEELTNLWHCSIKTVRRRLLKYSNENRILFTSGNGRGNLSNVCFYNSFYDDFNKEISTALRQRHYDDLAFLLQLDYPQNWLFPYLGEINSLFKFIQQDKYQTSFKGFFSRPISSLDPMEISSALEAFILSHIGNTLFLFDNESCKIRPNIAHHWVYLSEKKEWIFYIRKGIYFHDGSSLTAYDIEYSLNRILNSKMNNWIFSEITEITAKAPFIISLKTVENSCIDVLRLLSMITTTIIPKKYEHFEDNFIGSGPFMVDTLNEKKVILKTFEFYFGYRPMIDKAEFWILKNKSITPFLINENQHLKMDDGFSYLMFNHTHSMFKNKKNRKAISILFNDYDIISQKQSYFENPSHQKNDSEKIEFTYNDYLTLGFFDSSDSKKEAYQIKSFFEKRSIKVNLVCISKNDFFRKKDVFEKIDLLLAGELPGEDKELSFLNFIMNDNMPNRRLLPETLFLFINDLKKNENIKNLNTFTRIIEQNLLDNYHIIYLERKTREHNLLDKLLLNNITNSYGFMRLNDLWIVD